MTRPGFHVTAPSGWINDPLGVTWHGSRYELFVQHNPDAPEWAPACRWGQLTAPDLVRWRWVGTALTPAAGEGCWSGAVAVGPDGVPVILYTSVRTEALDVGAVALAVGDPDWRTWTIDPAGPVVPGPPPDVPMTSFRDPFVRRDGNGWRMVVGGGLADGRPAAVQYSSTDLRRWTFDGVVADAPGPGSVWECVQLFPLEGAWVLLVSVWDDGSPRHVACAVGAYDGGRFTPWSWRRFTVTDAVYATTTFPDAAGRRGAISWVREPAGAGWAGMLSLPVVLSRDGDRVLLTPHPDVDGLRTGVLADLAPSDGEVLGPFDPFLDLTAELAPGGGTVRLTVGDLLTAVVGDGGVRLARPGRDDERISVPPGPARLRVLLDAGLAEVFAGGDAAVLRLDPAPGPVTVRVSAAGGAGVRRLTVHGMPAPGLSR